MYSVLKMFLYRCRCSRLFWISVAASFAAGIIFGYSTRGYYFGDKGSFDDMFIAPLFVIECGFISLMIGREYSDGTIRNKLIAGKRRGNIYSANVVMAVLSTTLFVVVFVIGCMIMSYSGTLKYLKLDTRITVLIAFFLINYAWASIFVFVSMLISSREMGVLINLALVIGIMFASYQVEHLLGQPEFLTQENVINSVELSPEEISSIHKGTFYGNYWYEENPDGMITYYKDILNEEKVPNPKALGPITKAIFTHIDYFMPYGQVNTYVSFLTSYLYSEDSNRIVQEYSSIKTFPIYSSIVIGAMTLLGRMFFRRKDIK